MFFFFSKILAFIFSMDTKTASDILARARNITEAAKRDSFIVSETNGTYKTYSQLFNWYEEIESIKDTAQTIIKLKKK